jgi:alkylresorcinol/alkylpyrone synthase
VNWPRYDQRELAETFIRLVPGFEQRREAITRFFRHTAVESRYLALPIEAYAELDTFGQRNTVWLEVATALATEAVEGVLLDAGANPRDVGEIVTTTVTGIAVPSIYPFRISFYERNFHI